MVYGCSYLFLKEFFVCWWYIYMVDHFVDAKDVFLDGEEVSGKTSCKRVCMVQSYRLLRDTSHHSQICTSNYVKCFYMHWLQCPSIRNAVLYEYYHRFN